MRFIMRARLPKDWEGFVKQTRVIGVLYIAALVIDILIAIFFPKPLNTFDRVLLAGVISLSIYIIFYYHIFINILRKIKSKYMIQMQLSRFGKSANYAYWYGRFLMIVVHLVFIVHFLIK